MKELVMRTDRIRRRLTAALLFCMLVICMPSTVMAGYTKVGEAASKEYVKSSDNRQVIIYVGDSRAMMCTYPKKASARRNYCFCWVNGGNVSIIGKNGKLTPYVENMIERYRDRCVVALNLGVNGNSNPKKNARRIIRQYRRWMKNYPDVKFFVVSVNPTTLRTGAYSNKKVVELNELLREEFEPEGLYIDTFTPVMESGLVTGAARGMKDNYHYKWPVSRKVLKIVRRYITSAMAQQQAALGA